MNELSLVSFSGLQAHGIDHLVIPTRDYLFAPSFKDINQAVDFIYSEWISSELSSKSPTYKWLFHLCDFYFLSFILFTENASCGVTTYVHCKAGRGRSTTIVLCYLVIFYLLHLC